MLSKLNTSVNEQELLDSIQKGNRIEFFDAGVSLALEGSTLIGDSPYGNIDYLGNMASPYVLKDVLLWAKSWVGVSASFA